MTDDSIPDPPSPARTWSHGGRWVVWLAGLALAGGAVAYVRWHPEPAPLVTLPDITRAQPGDDPEGADAPPNPGYLGPRACAVCHADRVAEFLGTPHARACRRPAAGPMPAGFAPGAGRFTTPDRGVRFDMTRIGGEYFQTATQIRPGGEYRATTRIDLVYGANRADEMFFSWQGDRLYELMTAWIHPLNRWANTSFDPHGSGDFVRETMPRCVECHNTWAGHVPGTANQFQPDTVVLGVTCERCHGPGREHVEFHQAHPGDRTARAVVRPGRLPRERLIEVCTQCHGNATRARGPAFSYRPGRPLDAYFRTSRTRHPEEDHVANQIKYLRESRCFRESQTLTCVTCHDPHRPHSPTDPRGARGSCRQCHPPGACRDGPNLPDPIRDECVACHMPQRVWMNVHFHTEDDRYVPAIRRYQHRIAVDRVARAEVLLGWHRSRTGDGDRAEAARLTAELTRHWLAESVKLRREYRFHAAIGAAREALRLDLPPELRDEARAALREAVEIQTGLDADLVDALQAESQQRYGAAAAILERALKVKPDWATPHSKLGTILAKAGERERAVKHLEAVARHDPNDASGLAMLGWLAYLDGRAGEAAEYYRQAEEVEPYDAKVTYFRGLASLKLGRWSDAADNFRRVLTIDPHHAGASQGLSHALREQGQSAEAVKYGRRAARQTEFRVADVLVTLAEAYAAAGRVPEAAAAAARGLEADGESSGGSQLPFAARRRLQEIRLRAGP